jgi:hypothetical protein
MNAGKNKYHLGERNIDENPLIYNAYIICIFLWL